MNKLIIIFLIFTVLIVQKTVAQYSCASAISISSGYSASNITTDGTHNWITSATTTGCSGSSSFYTAADNYAYTFTTGSNALGYNINAKITAKNSWMIAGLYSTCSGTAISGCVADDYIGSSTPDKALVMDCNLAPNTTYYLIISRSFSLASAKTLSFDFNYFTLIPKTNYEASDECASATVINFDTEYSGITAACYTPSAQAYCWGSNDNDSWIKFTASATTVNFDYSLTNCSDPANGIQFAMYTSCGSGLVTGSCNYGVTGTGTYTVTGLTIGTEYILRIDGWAGNVCEFNLDPATGVAVTPTNDVCADAQVLTCGTSDIESNILAGSTDAPTGCSGGGTPANGVWYKFVGTGQNVTVSTDYSETNFDTDINVYSGSCGTLTCVGGDTDSGSGTKSLYTFYAAVGTDYFIYVDGNGAAEGQFKISVTCANCNANAGSWD